MAEFPVQSAPSGLVGIRSTRLLLREHASKTARLLLVLLAVWMCGSSAAAEEYEGYGAIDDPDEGEHFLVPIGQQRTVDGRTSGHGVRIFGGQPNQLILNVDYLLRFDLPGAERNEAPLQAFAVTLDDTGQWMLLPDRSWTLTSALRPHGAYRANLRAQILAGGQSKADYQHFHNFTIQEDP